MPESPEDIRDAIEALERYDGVTATVGGTTSKRTAIRTCGSAATLASSLTVKR